MGSTSEYRPDSSGRKNPVPARVPRQKNQTEADSDEEQKHQLDVEG
jgi:hypothetical protein